MDERGGWWEAIRVPGGLCPCPRLQDDAGLAAEQCNHWSPDLWPPNSPDLNPLDHFIWGVLETKTNNRFHPNMESIRQSVIEEFSLLERDLVIKACKVFRTRIEQAIAANGGYIEKFESALLHRKNIFF